MELAVTLTDDQLDALAERVAERLIEHNPGLSMRPSDEVEADEADESEEVLA
jgi:hypothetical protein